MTIQIQVVQEAEVLRLIGQVDLGLCRGICRGMNDILVCVCHVELLKNKSEGTLESRENVLSISGFFPGRIPVGGFTHQPHESTEFY